MLCGGGEEYVRLKESGDEFRGEGKNFWEFRIIMR
jgi:hypothetical protein